MKSFQRIVNGAVLGLNVLLIFFLVFQERLVFPLWMQAMGRMHPLLLHLPIGAMIVAFLFLPFKNEFKTDSFQKIISILISIAAVTAALSAIMGFILSREGGYSLPTLRYHLMAGSILSFLLWMLLTLNPERKLIFNGMLSISILTLLVAGHFGSSLTHGENFVLSPLLKDKDTQLVVTDSTSFYQAAIAPIFKAKCVSCHSEAKRKGNLVMTSAELLVLGGKHGKIWTAGNPTASALIQRINLPAESDEHMPPVGKAQLTESEKRLLFQWIAEGADMKKAWTRFKPTDSLRKLASEFIHHEKNQQPEYGFPFVAPEAIAKLNTPYRTVTQLALESPALSAEFFVSQAFQVASLEQLLVIKNNLISLSLADMPITNTEGKIINQFINLEKLNLNDTKVTGAILLSLANLKKLKTLSITGVSIDSKSLEQIAELSGLREVFIWNSGLEESKLLSLKMRNPKITWNVGYPVKEVLRLTPPLLVNDSLLIKQNQKIQLKHNLKGTLIRYTLDGTAPDSLHGQLFKEPISITGFTRLKAIATHSGWWSSKVAEFTFFKSGFLPLSAKLFSSPDKRYKGEGIITLIDNKKSLASDYRESAWLGFREQPLDALFFLDSSKHAKTITLCYAKNYYSYLVPPESVELWAGNKENELAKIETIQFPSPKQKDITFGEDALIFNIRNPAKYYRLIARPVAKLPEFISKKREKGWLFVDEVIFN